MAKLLRDMTEPELEGYFNNLAGLVESVTPQGSLFFLLVFDDPGLAQYVSNANRADMVRALRETADRIEKRDTIERVEAT